MRQRLFRGGAASELSLLLASKYNKCQAGAGRFKCLEQPVKLAVAIEP
ncbi:MULTISPECIES: hypothetical protein [unclassified Chamaesiphon]|nr:MULTISPECIES: hypothetical protein [unclassified Chamaesiphon]